MHGEMIGASGVLRDAEMQGESGLSQGRAFFWVLCVLTRRRNQDLFLSVWFLVCFLDQMHEDITKEKKRDSALTKAAQRDKKRHEMSKGGWFSNMVQNVGHRWPERFRELYAGKKKKLGQQLSLK